VPARLGWIFGLTLLILLVGSINYALSLGFALTFLLGGVGLVGMVHTARNLARIALSVGRAAPVFAGESAQFRLFLDGCAPFDRPAILARHLSSGAQLVVDVPAGGIAEAVLAVPAARRGWLPLGRVMLETRFPLGLFRAWTVWRPLAQLLVYPRVEVDAPALPAARPVAGGATVARRSEGGEVEGVRAYRRGDPLKLIAWKKAAQALETGAELVSRDTSTSARQELWLDWSACGPLAAEARLSRLAAWTLAAHRADADYGLRLPGLEIEAGDGEAQRTHCLESLALWHS
jgi:uncharacterized protein (DUF58 family)